MLPTTQFVRPPTRQDTLLRPLPAYHSARGAREPMIGSSPVLLQALEKARQAARSDADILLEAESGTGKELLARLIHDESPRSGRPFVAINCAAVPDTLLESELFGHVRGAFTGAIGSKPRQVRSGSRRHAAAG